MCSLNIALCWQLMVKCQISVKFYNDVKIKKLKCLYPQRMGIYPCKYPSSVVPFESLLFLACQDCHLVCYFITFPRVFVLVYFSIEKFWADIVSKSWFLVSSKDSVQLHFRHYLVIDLVLYNYEVYINCIWYKKYALLLQERAFPMPILELFASMLTFCI